MPDIADDPVTRLAFSVQQNPGVYALLLGSGVSFSSQIPTGWAITHSRLVPFTCRPPVMSCARRVSPP